MSHHDIWVYFHNQLDGHAARPHTASEAVEVTRVFGGGGGGSAGMGFELVASGQTHLYNDKGQLELMPKAEYALLRDGGGTRGAGAGSCTNPDGC